MRALHESGDVDAAAHFAGRLYGPEIFGFLQGAAEETATREVYRAIVRRIADEISRFDWSVTLRTWMYTRARRELARQRAGAASPGLRDSLEPVAIPTESERRLGEPMAFLATLRSQLAPEDREILILRVDRRFSWWDLAFTALADRPRPHEILAESKRLRLRIGTIRASLRHAASCGQSLG